MQKLLLSIFSEPVQQHSKDKQQRWTKNLSAGLIKNIRVPVPPIQEQIKIAQIISTWDKAITITEQLLDNSKQQKKALMQKLLTGKKRFFEFSAAWEIVEQGKYVKFINGRAYKLKEWEATGTPVIRLQNLTGRGEEYYYSNLSLPEHQYCDAGDLLYMWSATFGPHIWQGPRAIYHYHIWKVECDPKFVERQFFFYLLEFETARWMSQSNGMGLLHITKGTMEKQKIGLPAFEEQRKIAAALSNSDSEIELIKDQIDHLKAEKKALMQQLLTGKRRVNLNAGDC